MHAALAVDPAPDPSPGPPAVAAHALSRRYGRRWALARVSFEVPAGAVTMLTGPNGAGKSTLLRVLATALAPHGGTARVAGFDVRDDAQEVRRRTALLDHRLQHYGPLSARDNLRVAARLLGRDPGTPVKEALARVGLDRRADDAVATFSAGMRKRLALARVLLQRPRVVLLDEPYGELDPAGFRLVDGLLQAFREDGVTVLLSTHLVARGKDTCDLAVALEDGRVTYAGPAADGPGGDGA